MKIVFHIGMGKTGTSSIQSALTTNQGYLKQQNVRYLGMWFEDISPRFLSYDGLTALTMETPAAQAAHAKTYAQFLREVAQRENIDQFLHSNEGLFTQGGRLTPFFQALSNEMDVRFLAYMRPPHSWLPSAFSQWNIRHKAHEGPVQPFSQNGRTLIAQYTGIRAWQNSFSDKLTVRLFAKGVDVVQDYAKEVGIDLITDDKRLLERDQPAETVMRALYNDRFANPVLPQQFNAVVLKGGRQPKSIREMTNLCFDHAAVDEIITENKDLFDEIAASTGLDLIQLSEASSIPNYDDLQEGILDFMLEVILQQSQRIKRLEKLMAT